MAQLQYGPQQRELAYQRRAAVAHAQQLPVWLDEYQATIKAAVDAQNARYQAAQQAAYGQANQMQAADSAAIDAQAKQRAEEAAARGTTVDPAVEQMARAAAGQRQSAATAWGGLVGAQGAAMGTIGAGQVQGAAAHSQAALNAQIARSQKLDQLAEDLAREIGTFKSNTRFDLEESDRKAALEREIFEKEFGLKVAGQNNQLAVAKRYAKARERAARANRAAAEAQAEAKKNAKTTVINRYPDGGGRPEGKSGSSIPKSYVTNYRRQFRKGLDLVKRSIGARGEPPSRGEAVDALVSQYGVNDAFLASVAFSVAVRGGVEPKTAARLWQDYGLRVPKLKRRARRSGPTPKGGARTY